MVEKSFLVINGKTVGLGGKIPAKNVTYSNIDTDLKSIDVQNAINEVYAKSVKASEKGQANGVATLNLMGVIPSEQLNVTGLDVKGTWDASTNTPFLANGNGESGDFYIVNVAGSANFGAGEIDFAVGDWVLYTANGTWVKSVNASAVQSVNGKTGVVNILDTDVLNEAQIEAVNSEITKAKVQQIETNKTKISETKTNLETLQTTVENLSIPTTTSQLTNDSDFQTSEQVNTIVTNEVAKIVADAPENLDTFKDVSDWITEHQNDVSAMNEAILENKNNIANIINDTNLNSKTSTLSADKIVSYVAENLAPTSSGTVIPTPIASGATVTTDWNILSAGSNAEYGRLLMLNSNIGSFLIYVKGNLGNTSSVPTPTVVSSVTTTQSGTWSASFELSVSGGKLRIKNKSGAVASWRFI